jgi:glycosyltransferase involved in cell wall biosynthesis
MSHPGGIPDFSVVIPTFRRPEPLAEAIRSVLVQPGVDVEVMVIDDSPEGSGNDVVRSIGDSRVTYRKVPIPSGGNPSLVRNIGWPLARGRYVHFLDDDDRAAPGVYREIAAAFRGHPSSGVVIGQVRPFGSSPEAVERESALFTISARRARRLHLLGWKTWVAAYQLFCSPTLLVCSACIIRREHLAPLGGFDESVRVMEDVEFYVRAIRTFGSTYLDRPLVEYRTGAPSLMNSHMSRKSPAVGESYRHMYARYVAEHGALELTTLKLLARGPIRLL